MTPFRFLLLTCIVLAMAASPVRAQQCTLYINASDGDDANPGTQVQPLRSLETGFTRASDGQIVCVAGGEYFLGPDGDGVLMTGAGKNVDFVLESFAGNDEIRVSERFLAIDNPGGTVRFLSGTASRLVLGTGILNTPGSGRDGVLRSLELRAGTLDVQSVSLVLEDAVGRIASAEARIRFAEGMLIGQPVYSPSQTMRRVVLDGANPDLTITEGLLPESMALQIAHGGAVRLDAAIALDPALLTVGGSGRTDFLDTVTFTGSAVAAPLEPGFTGELRFDTELVLTRTASVSFGSPTGGDGGGGSGGGAGSINVNRLVFGAQNAEITFLTANAAIAGFDDATSSGKLTLAGTMTRIGTAGATTQLPRTVTIQAQTTPQGPVQVTGLLQVQEQGHVSADGASAAIRSGSYLATPLLFALDGSEILNEGAIDGLTIQAGPTATDTAILAGNGHFGLLDVPAGGHTTLGAAASLSADRLAVGGRLAAAPTAELTLHDAANIETGAELDDFAGTLHLGASATAVDWASTATLPRLTSVASMGRIAGPDLLTFREPVSVTGGSLELVAPNGLSFRDGLEVLFASAVLMSDVPARFGGVVRLRTASIDWPVQGIGAESGSTMTLDSDILLVLPVLTMDAPGGNVQISGTVSIASDLDLLAGELSLENSSNLYLKGDLVQNGGILDASDGATITMDGSEPQRISGFQSIVLPSLVINGFEVTLTESASLAGRLSLRRGTLMVASGSTINIQSSVDMSGGVWLAESGSTLNITGSLTQSAGNISMTGVFLRLAGNLASDGGLVSLADSELILNGQGTQSVDVNGSMDLARLVVESRTGLGTGQLVVSDDVRIPGTLDILDGAVIMTGAGPSPTLTVGGTLSGATLAPGSGATSSTGALSLTGPSGSDAFAIEAAGRLGALRVQLSDDQTSIPVSSPDAIVRVGGDIDFRSGGLAIGSHTLLFENRPTVHLNLSDNVTGSGSGAQTSLPDGRGWSGTPSFDPSSRYNLRYYGSIQTLYAPGLEFQSGLIDDLVVGAVDASNTPPVFGIRPAQESTIAGVLRVENGALLRLSGVNLLLAGSGTDHRIEGTIAGSGHLVVRGDAASLTGATNTPSRIDRLRLEPTGSASLVNIRQAVDLHASSGTVTLFGDTPLQISERFTASRARYTVRQPVRLGAGITAALLSLDASEILFGANGSLNIGGNPDIRVPAGSRIDLEPSTESSIADGSMAGYVTMTRSANLVAAGGIARLRMDAPASSDDTLLGSDLLITDRFDLVNGDVFVGSHHVIFDGANVHMDRDGTPGDGSSDGFFGDLSSQSGQMRFLGASRLTLGNNLSLQSVGLLVDAGTDTLRVESDSGSRVIVSSGAPVVLQSGVLDLGGNDLEITGSTAGILTLGGGYVRGNGVDAGNMLLASLDGQHGEVIVSGAGSASIDVLAESHVDNLRISGPVQVRISGGFLGVERRLVFGRSGASMVAGAPTDIHLGDGAWIIRRGTGTLSHPLTLSAPPNVFYDLDDGTLSGTSTGFQLSELTTGLELPETVGHLVIMAGNHGTVQHTLRLNSSLTVSAGLHVFSGRLQATGQTIAVAPGATWEVEQLDSASPGTLTGDTGGITGGPVQARVAARIGRLDLGTAILPAGLLLNDVDMTLEETSGVAPSVRLTRGLSVRNLAIRAVSGPAGSAVVRLDGNPLLASGSFSVRDVTVTSAQFATIEVLGETFLGPSASLSGSIDLTASGPARLEGAFSGLVLRVARDLETTLPISQASEVFVTGTDQTWHTNGDPLLGRLRMEQHGATARLRVRRTDATPVTLTIAEQLSLDGGRLDVGDGLLLLPGSSGGFERSAGNGPSHVIGRTGRRAPSETREDFVFPVGTADAYTPLTITFASPLLSSTDLVAGVRSSEVVSREGLPVTASDGRVLVDVGPVVWTLASSVNFAQSQPVTVSVALPGVIAGPAAEHRLLRRDAGLQGGSSGGASSGSWAAPWTAPGGSPIASSTSSSLIVRQIDATGLLSQQGVEFGVGTTETTEAGSGRIVLVNAVDGPASMTVGGEVFEFVTSQVTNSIRVRPGTFSWSVGSEDEGGMEAGDGGSVESREVTVSDGEQAWLVLAPGGDGSAVPVLGFAVVEPIPAFAVTPGDGTVSGRLLNARSTNAEIVMTEAGGMPIFFNEGAAPGELYPTVSNPPFNPEARLQHYAVLALPDHTGDVFSIDLTPASGSYGLFIATDGRLDFASSTGLFLDSWISTGVEGDSSGDGSADGSADGDPANPGAELPTEYRLGQNYPNPFNPTTVIPFDLPEPAAVRLTVVDLLGRVVARQDAGTFPAGRHTSLRFSADGLASGTYLYVVEAAGAGRGAGSAWRATGRMILLR